MKRLLVCLALLFLAACGSTTESGRLGADCTQSPCQEGLTCIDGSCAAPSAEGGPCSSAWPCQEGKGLACVNGKCAKESVDGDGDDDDRDAPERDGSEADADSNESEDTDTDTDAAETDGEPSESADANTNDGDTDLDRDSAEDDSTESDSADNDVLGDTDREGHPPGLSCAEGVCTDPATGFTWQQAPLAQKIAGDDASAYCVSLTLNGGGWRLPNVSELSSLVRNCDQTRPDGVCGVADACTACGTPGASCLAYECAVSDACLAESCSGNSSGPDCRWPQDLSGSCGAYWSSSMAGNWEYYTTWIVNFDNGAPGYRNRANGSSAYEQENYAYVRCVRGTGEGKSPDCKAKLASDPGNGQYACCGGVCVDPATGIEWQQTPFGVKGSLSDNNCGDLGRALGQESEWDIPSLAALRILYLHAGDSAATSYCSWPDDIRGPCASYWSSTITTQSRQSYYWMKDFINGDDIEIMDPRFRTAYVRCVRYGENFCSPWASTRCYDGNVYYNNCRGELVMLAEDCGECLCTDGTCLKETKKCYRGDIYRFDCRDLPQEKTLECGTAPCETTFCDPKLTWAAIPGSSAQPAFEMTSTKITNLQYRIVTGKTPDPNSLCGENCPAIVPWYEAQGFCLTVGGRLASTSEWEYAARAGTSNAYICGDDVSCLDTYAWPCDSAIQPVAGKLPNNWELYDMTGNGVEWIDLCSIRHETGFDIHYCSTKATCQEPISYFTSAVNIDQGAGSAFRCVRGGK